MCWTVLGTFAFVSLQALNHKGAEDFSDLFRMQYAGEFVGVIAMAIVAILLIAVIASMDFIRPHMYGIAAFSGPTGLYAAIDILINKLAA